MPTKRTPVDRPIRARVTPDLVALWRRIMEIREAGLDGTPEREGGRQEEHLDALHRLDRGLGLRPWQDSPVDVPPHGKPPPWARRASYETAQIWRRALEEAADADR